MTVTPLMPLLIRPMQAVDIDEVMLLEERSFPEPWPRSLYERELRNNRFSHYRVVVPVRPVASWPALLAQGGYWLMGEEIHIVTLAVQPQCRGVGLGKWLLLRLLDEARQQGGRLATLEVRPGNQSARRLYERLGFQQIGQRKRYYPNGEDALILELSDLGDDAVWSPLANMLSALDESMLAGVLL